MLELRDYQQEAINALYGWFEAGKGNPLVVAPTGSGKSVMLAEFMRSALERFPQTRILCVTHVKELIVQNHAALLRLWPNAPAGIYSAGLGRKQLHSQITFAGVQSIARKARDLGHVDLVIVDEAHLIPRKNNTQYGKLLEVLSDNNPTLKVIGFTATPYRLDTGRLDAGKGAIFDGIAYDIPLPLLIERGYLAPLISKRPKHSFDTAGLHTRMGDFVESEMAERFNTEGTTIAAVREIMGQGADRASWLLFCINVDHAHSVRDVLHECGTSCAAITGGTPQSERDRLLRGYKTGEIQALTSVGVLTTGFDAPRTDLLAFLRPTQSLSLYVQMAGRGMRIAPQKSDCLVLDFAGNVMRHGPVDCIDLPSAKKKKGEAPTKTCPECDEILHISARVCPVCDYEFEIEEKDPLERKPSAAPIMNMTAEENWWQVQVIEFSRHTKPNSPDSFKVEYLLKKQPIEGYGDSYPVADVREWVCFEHSSYARQKAVQWWTLYAGTEPPKTVSEALSRLDEITLPSEVVLMSDGKYSKIKRVRFGAEVAA